MDSSTGEQQEMINGMSRDEQLLLTLFRSLTTTDQSYLIRIAGALSQTEDAEQQ